MNPENTFIFKIFYIIYLKYLYFKYNKYLKSCLPKGSWLDTTILLLPISLIKIGLLFWWNMYSSICILQCNQLFKFFYPFLVSYSYKKALFFYAQPIHFFYLLRDFCNVHDHIVAFFLLFFLQKTFDIFLKIFFVLFLL